MHIYIALNFMNILYMLLVYLLFIHVQRVDCVDSFTPPSVDEKKPKKHHNSYICSLFTPFMI